MELPTRIRATRKGGKTVVAVLVKNADIPARTESGFAYLAHLKLDSGEVCIAEVFAGAKSAPNLLLKFDIEEMAAGAQLAVSWNDNADCHGFAETKVS
jgi:hypothetical protein